MSLAVAVKILAPDGSEKACTLEVQAEGSMTLLCDCGDYFARAKDDLFDTMLQLRVELERSGFRLLCNGARRDVYPSGMSRSMSGGRKAYSMKIGAPATKDDIVDIFDYTPGATVGTVEDQQTFRRAWIESLTSKIGK